MNFEDLQHHLEPDTIGNAPAAVKAGVFITLFQVSLGAVIYFYTQNH